MTTAQSRQQPPVKRRKMNTIYLGAIGQDEVNPTSAGGPDGEPQTSTNGATDFASFHQAMTADQRRKNDGTVTIESIARPTDETTRLSMLHGVDPKNSFASGVDSSYGAEFSTDSDVFTLATARNTHRTSTTLEPLEVPKITKDIQILPRQVRLAASATGEKENVIEPPPEITKELVIELEMRNDCPVSTVIASTSAPHSSGLKCARVTGRGELNGKVWDVLLSGPITLLEANHNWTLTACSNRQMSVIRTPTGKLQRTLRFTFPVAIVVLHGGISLVMLADATLSTWNLNTNTSIVQTSLSAALRSSPETRISHCAISDSGVPMVLLNNDECLVYSKSMNVWLEVCMGVDPISKYVSSLQHIIHVAPNGLLALLAKQKAGQSEKSTLDIGISASCEETQLEALLSACQPLESWAELRLIFVIYARNLLKRNKRAKLAEALNDLSTTNDPTIFDDLLRRLQPIFEEYETSYEKLKCEDENLKINLSFID